MQKIAGDTNRMWLASAAVALLLLTASARCVSAQAVNVTNSSADKVAVVPKPTASDTELIKAVAELGASQTVQFRKGADVGAYVLGKCGRPSPQLKIHPTYEQILLERNSGLSQADLDALTSDRLIQIPACAVFAELATVPTPNGVEQKMRQLLIPFNTSAFARVVNDPKLKQDAITSYQAALVGRPANVESIARTVCSIGSAVAGCRNAVEIAVLNPNIVQSDRVNDVVVSLARAETAPDLIEQNSRVALRSDVTEIQARSSIPQLQNLEGPIRFVTEVDGPNANYDDCIKSAETRQGAWPYRLDDFIRVISLNDRVDGRETRRILIVDTGFDFSDPVANDSTSLVFDPDYFFRLDKQADPSNSRDLNADGVKGNGGFAGVNLSGIGATSSATSAAYRHRSHGLSVAALALGGRPVENLRRALRLPIRLGFASLVDRQSTNPLIDTSHIEKALRFAAASGNEFNVVNLSLSSTDTIPGWEDIVKRRGTGRVFVVAAGNDEKPLNAVSGPVWPAAFGGTPASDDNAAGVVISVGAHTGSGRLAKFSNRGTAVDVLAPGCGIPTYVLRLENDRPIGIEAQLQSGTSFAAPLVSFVSALLMTSPRLSGRPGLVKARIQASSDYDWDLRDDVFSAGTLNVGKVLSFSNDVLELRDDESSNKRLVYGSVLNRAGLGMIECRTGQRLAFDTIKKIARSGEHDLLVFSNPNDEKPTSAVRTFCEKRMLDDIEFEFLNKETGATSKIPGRLVMDYIPAP